MSGQHNTKNAALADAITQQSPPVMPYVPPGQFIDIDERFYRGVVGTRHHTKDSHGRVRRSVNTQLVTHPLKWSSNLTHSVWYKITGRTYTILNRSFQVEALICIL